MSSDDHIDRKAAILAALTYIDQNLPITATWVSTTEQVTGLHGLAEQQQLMTRGTRVVDERRAHNGNSLRKLLATIVRQKSKARSSSLADLFLRGSVVLKDDYLREIELTLPDDSQLDGALLSPHTGASDVEDTAEHGGQLAGVTKGAGEAGANALLVRQGQKRKEDATMGASTSRPATRAQKKKRSESSSLSDVDELLLQEVPVLESHHPTRTTSPNASLNDGEADGGVKSQPRATSHAQGNKQSEVLEEVQSDQAVPMINATLHAPPGAQGTSASQHAATLPQTRPTPRSEITFGISDKDIEAAMSRLWHLINNLSATLHGSGAGNETAAALIPDPQGELAKLYTAIFGGQRWRQRSVELRVAIGLSSIDVLSCLISMGVCSSVFPFTTPWRIQAVDTDALGPKWVAMMDVLADDGYEVNQLLDRAASRMITQPNFEANSLAAHAATLADTLALTLYPHIECIPGSRQPSISHAWSVEVGLVRWMADLRGVFRSALLLKAKMETTSDTVYNFQWYQGGVNLVGGEMEMLYHGDLPQKVAITVMPAVSADSARDGKRNVKRAVVLSHPAGEE